MYKRIVVVLLFWLVAGSISLAQASAAELAVCNGFISRVSVGDFALTTSPALNIRQAPRRDAQRLRTPLEPGTLVEILQGATCADGFTWWRVSAAGIVGWVSEGNTDNYFLSAPVDPDNLDSGDDFDTNNDPNPNPPLGTLDGRPGGGNFEDACRGTSNDSVIGRESSFGNDFDSGSFITFTPFLNVLEVDTPAICVGANFSADGAIAVAPDGTVTQPSVTPFSDFNGNTYTLVQLPLQAFFLFGQWRLEAAGFTLNIDLRQPDQPYALYTFLNDGQIIVGGLQPSERFIASGTGDDGGSVRWFGAVADSHGTFIMALSQLPWFSDFPEVNTNFLYSSVTQIDLVGQLGSFLTLDGVQVTHPDTGFNWYRIPTEYAAPLMREIVWGGQAYDEQSAMDLLRSWTCLGASPIRLNPDENGNRAFVANDVGAQPIRSAPSVNADILETYQPGDFVVFENTIACGDNAVWWAYNGGWFMESQGGQYFWVQ